MTVMCIELKPKDSPTVLPDSIHLGETVPSVCSETGLTLSADGSEVSDMRVEEVL